MYIKTEILREETYTFTPNDGTEEVHIRSGRLREMLHKYAMSKVIELTFPSDETTESIVERHGLEADRIKSMTEEQAKEPVIVGLWPGGTHILIDGGHRRHYWAERGVHVLRGWAVPMEVWIEFIFDPSDAMIIDHDPTGMKLPQRQGVI